MFVKPVVGALLLVLLLSGCAEVGDTPLAAATSTPPDACSPGASFATSDDYMAGRGPEDRTGGAATPEDAARDYAASMRPPGPAQGWTQVADESPGVSPILVAAEDYRLRAFTLKDGTWLVSSGYRCASG